MKWREIESRAQSEVERLKTLDANLVLGIEANATPEQIRNAFRSLVKTYHPDRAHPFMREHNEQVIRVIISAYEKMIGKSGGRT